MLLAQIAEFRGVADIDQAKRFIFADAEGDFPVASCQMIEVEGGDRRCVEDGFQDVGENLSRSKSTFHQERECVAENVVAFRVEQASVAGEQPLNPGDGIVASLNEPGKKEKNINYVRNVFTALGADCGNLAADQNPEWAFNQEGPELGLVFREKYQLLVEGQKAGGKIQAADFCVPVVREIQNAVILSKTVVVEILVGIVKQDAFGVFFCEFRFVGGFERLAERGGILEREPLFAKAVAIALPFEAASAAVALIH
ncbi:MAG: hypothetical protein ABSA47_05850 [Verrucomicrobiota bacterium]